MRQEMSGISQEISEKRYESGLEEEFENRILVTYELGSMVKEIHNQHWTKGVSGKRYRIDIALIGKGFKVGIEIQGKQWHSEPWQVKRDIERAEDLKKAGWVMLEFTSEEIYDDSERVANDIEEAIEFNRNLESEY